MYRTDMFTLKNLAKTFLEVNKHLFCLKKPLKIQVSAMFELLTDLRNIKHAAASSVFSGLGQVVWIAKLYITVKILPCRKICKRSSCLYNKTVIFYSLSLYTTDSQTRHLVRFQLIYDSSSILSFVLRRCLHHV
jgi:hypothetical protein